MFRMPATREDFWRAKIAGTKQRDRRNTKALLKAGWRILVLWECATRGPRRLAPEAILEECYEFVAGKESSIYAGANLWEIAGGGDPGA